MEVRKGYKQTDAGIIPEDWDVNTLESTTPPNRPNGIVDGPFGSNLKTIHYRKFGIPIITSGYVTDGKFFASEYLYVDKEKFSQEKRSAVNPGDIVMAKIGARCGASAILPKNHEIGILSGNALKVTVDNSRHSTYYIWKVLWDLYSNGNIEALRTVGAQPAISMANLKKYKIPLPPLPEQEAIAEALSDADAFIEAVEQLLTKKRQVKQGAMSELLTGKRRLARFGGEWETKPLKEVGEITGAGVDKKIKPDDLPVRLVNYLDVYHRDYIYSKDLNHYVTAPTAQAQRCSVKKGDIFFTPSSEMPYDIAVSAIAMEDIPDAAYSYHVVRLRLNEHNDWNLDFRNYIFKTKYFLDQAETFCEGSGKRYVITLKRFRELKVYYPIDIAEQTAIAEILSDMDAEITALEGKLVKARQVKAGMMSELLAGKTRLI